MRSEIVAVLAQIIVDVAEVVVDHVENHAQADRVRLIDEPAKIVRLPIQPRGREHAHAVVTPTEAAGKIGHRQHFNRGDADPLQLRQFARAAANVPSGVNVPMCIS